MEQPLVSSTVAILVLLHLIVCTIPIESLPLATLAILLTYMHLIWCNAATRDLREVNDKTIEKKSLTGDRERRLIASTLDFCSEIRHTIAQEIRKLRDHQRKSDNPPIVPPKLASPTLAPTMITPPNIAPTKITPTKITMANLPVKRTPTKSPRRPRSWSHDSPLKKFNAPESKLTFSRLKRWQRRRKVHYFDYSCFRVRCWGSNAEV